MSTNTVILDFETYRWEGELFEQMLKDTVDAVEAPGNYKKEESIKKYLDEERPKVADAFRQKAALSPLTGRLLVASLAIEKFDPEAQEAAIADPDNLDSRWDFKFFLAKTDDEEKELIRQVDDLLDDQKPKLLVTFSGRDFDIPFFIGRALINNMALRWPMPSYKYDRRHFDMRDAIPKGPLDHWLRAVLGEPKAGSGADVDGWVKEENWDALFNYCQDIRSAAALWERIRNVVYLAR